MRIVKQNGRGKRPEAISLPKNFVEGVDKCRRWVYYSVNITKMAVKRRVGFRIDPSREPGRWKRAGNRELKMVSEPRGRSARVLSLRRERPLQRPVVALQKRRSSEAVSVRRQ